MNCKFCDKPIEEGSVFCPHCGKKQTAPAKPKLWKLIVAGIGCLVLAGVLTVSVLEGMGIDATGKIAGIFQKKETQEDALEKKEDHSDVVVATIGDRELTNGELQVYYWTSVFDYINYYSSNLGFDAKKPLNEQVKDTKTGQTWQDYFLDMALKSWHRYEAMSIIAQKAGHKLTKDTQDYLDNLETYLSQTAKDNGFESTDAMIADRFGEGCALRHYAAFMEGYCIGLDFFDMISADVAPTDADIDAYYAEHEEELKKANASKADGNISSVRHILICPKGEEDSKVYTDAQWAEALKKAEEVLKEWKSGAATEQSFIELVKTKTEDTASISTGGLYEGVTKNSGYVTEFEDWARDPARTVGETGIVKTQYGYHIMYYVSGQPMWKSTCKEALITERISAKVDVAVEENPMTSDLTKVVLSDALSNKI